jgi:hypothetical protein
MSALYIYLQLLVWQKHGDDLRLTAANIVVTIGLWIILLFSIGRYWKLGKQRKGDTDWKKLYLETSEASAEFQKKYAEATNERDQSKAEVERVLASIRKPSFPEHPIPDLRLRIVEMCTELQAFIGRYGPDVITVRQPQEPVERFTARLSSPNFKEARIQLTGDYRLNYEKHVVQLRDQIGLRCAKIDEALDKAITLSGQGAGAAENLTIIIERFWELALNTNC